MTFNFETEVELNFDFDPEEIFKQAVQAVLDYAECPYEADVSLLITDENSMKELNRDMRGLDVPTDVLSFPMSEYDSPADFDALENNDDAFDPDSGELMLGDIVLCADRVISQATDFGHSKKREYAFLIVHSMLHLIGFDHIEEADRVLMESHQQKIMNQLNILR